MSPDISNPSNQTISQTHHFRQSILIFSPQVTLMLSCCVLVCGSALHPSTNHQDSIVSLSGLPVITELQLHRFGSQMSDFTKPERPLYDPLICGDIVRKKIKNSTGQIRFSYVQLNSTLSRYGQFKNSLQSNKYQRRTHRRHGSFL